MRRLACLATLATMAVLVLAPSAEAQRNTMTASILDFFFSPSDITVQPGTTVTWVNNGQASHTATATDPAGSFDSGRLQPGESFSLTLNQSGTYTYKCAIHPFMKGTVTVSGGGRASVSASASAMASASASAAPTMASSTASPAAGRTLPITGGGGWLVLPAAATLVV